MINLNNLKDKPFLTKRSLLKLVSDWEIYQYYSDKPLEINKLCSSPLRTDKKPSFSLFIGENHEICFKDFNLDSGDCIKFVMLKYNLDFYEAMSKIAIDFGIDSDFYVKRNESTDYNVTPLDKLQNFRNREETIKQLNTFKLGKSSREWEIRDSIFWQKYGISKRTLLKYNVSPISNIFFGDKIIYCKDLAYCYTEYKDKVETYKIYQPNSEDYKWLNNHDFSIWQGWSQLPEKDSKLIITKSLKDVMSIHDATGIPAVALQTENLLPKESVMDELKSRFDTIYVLYDNDFDKEENWGRIYGKNLSENFNLFQIEIPLSYTAKDFSDLVELYGRVKSAEILKELLKAPF